MRRIARLYVAAALSRLADAITAWRLAHGLLTAEEEAAHERAWRAAARHAYRPPPYWSPGGEA